MSEKDKSNEIEIDNSPEPELAPKAEPKAPATAEHSSGVRRNPVPWSDEQLEAWKIERQGEVYLQVIGGKKFVLTPIKVQDVRNLDPNTPYTDIGVLWPEDYDSDVVGEKIDRGVTSAIQALSGLTDNPPFTLFISSESPEEADINLEATGMVSAEAEKRARKIYENGLVAVVHMRQPIPGFEDLVYVFETPEGDVDTDLIKATEDILAYNCAYPDKDRDTNNMTIGEYRFIQVGVQRMLGMIPSAPPVKL